MVALHMLLLPFHQHEGKSPDPTTNHSASASVAYGGIVVQIVLSSSGRTASSHRVVFSIPIHALSLIESDSGGLAVVSNGLER